MLPNRLRAAAVVAAVAALLGYARPASAAFLNTTDRGWYDLSGVHHPTNDNYIVGVDSSNVYHNFFVFDLSSQTTPVTEAKLRLWNEDSNIVSGTATYTLHEVTTSIATLTAGTGGTAAFTDLGDGPVYGSISLGAADVGTFVEINLNATGLAALNAHLGGTFSIGGELATLNEEYIFGFTGTGDPADGNSQLSATSRANPVPAPPGAILAGIGVVGMIGFRALRRVRGNLAAMA
jgi:hypothetical protein